MGLEIEGEFNEQWGVVKQKIMEHDKILNGNGKQGVVEFVTGLKAQMRLLMILVTIFGAISAIGTAVIGLLEYNRQVHSGMIDLGSSVYRAADSTTAKELQWWNYHQ